MDDGTTNLMTLERSTGNVSIGPDDASTISAQLAVMAQSGGNGNVGI